MDAEPLEAAEDAADGLFLVPLLVGVLDAEDVDAALRAGVEVVEQRGAGAADVEVPRRGRGEADADGHGRAAAGGYRRFSSR